MGVDAQILILPNFSVDAKILAYACMGIGHA